MADKPRNITRVTLTPEQREAARKAHEEHLRKLECPEPGARLTTMDRIRQAPKRRRRD